MTILVQGIVGGPVAVANTPTTVTTFSTGVNNTGGIVKNVTHLAYSFISPGSDPSGFVSCSIDASPLPSSPDNFDKQNEIKLNSGFILDSFIRRDANRPKKKGSVYIFHPVSPNVVALVLRIDGLLNRLAPLFKSTTGFSNVPTITTNIVEFTLYPDQLAVGVLAVANYTMDDPVSYPGGWTVVTDTHIAGDDGNGVRLIIITMQVTVQTNAVFYFNLSNPYTWATIVQIYNGYQTPLGKPKKSKKPPKTKPEKQKKSKKERTPKSKKGMMGAP